MDGRSARGARVDGRDARGAAQVRGWTDEVREVREWKDEARGRADKVRGRKDEVREVRRGRAGARTRCAGGRTRCVRCGAGVRRGGQVREVHEWKDEVRGRKDEVWRGAVLASVEVGARAGGRTMCAGGQTMCAGCGTARRGRGSRGAGCTSGRTRCAGGRTMSARCGAAHRGSTSPDPREHLLLVSDRPPCADIARARTTNARDRQWNEMSQ